MPQTLSILSIVAFSIAGVSLALAIFFWFFFKIPSVIGDLSGKNARKSIAKMRAENEKTGVRNHKAGADRRKSAVPMKHSGKLNSGKKPEEDRPDTGLLTEDREEAAASEPTALLSSATTGLLTDEAETAPLERGMQQMPKPGKQKFIMLDEVMMIHTDEEIE